MEEYIATYFVLGAQACYYYIMTSSLLFDLTNGFDSIS